MSGSVSPDWALPTARLDLDGLTSSTEETYWQVEERYEHGWVAARTSSNQIVAQLRITWLRRVHPRVTFRLAEVTVRKTRRVVPEA